MLKKKASRQWTRFLSAKQEFAVFADKLDSGTYEEAADIILESQQHGGRLHITGI